MGLMDDGIFLSTDQVEPALRNSFWRGVLRPLFDAFPTESDGQLQGSALVRPIGGLTVASVSFNHQRHVRDSMTIATSTLDNYLLHFIVAGRCRAECDGISFVAGPGDICLFDLARPYTSRAQAGERISLAIPRQRIDRAAGGQRIHGLHLRSDDPLAHMLGQMLQNMQHRAGDIGADDMAAETAIVDFIAAIVADRARRLLPVESGQERNLRLHMMNFIDAHLGSPELGPAMLMRQFQISRAHLYRVFAAEGGVATVIRDRRLDIAYRRLAARSPYPPSITEVAYEMGFASSGQFSRAFRTRFGVTPRAIRFVERAGDPADGDNVGGTLLQRHFARQAKCWAARCAVWADARVPRGEQVMALALDHAASA